MPDRGTAGRLGRALGRVRRSTLAQNAIALYGVYVAGMVLPLITIPYLARVLRPEGWGLVVFAQSFAAWMALVVEYGFYLSATREIARARDDPERVARVVADVHGARLLLSLLIVTAGAAAYLLIPTFRASPTYLIWAVLFALAQGFSPLWYFQGVERMRLPAVLEVVAKTLATAGVFVLVHEPAHGWRVLALQALTGLGWIAVASVLIYREVAPILPTWGGAAGMLRQAAGLFVFRSATGMYLQANSFILGLVAGPQTVAFFGGAEKIVRAATGLIQPATQAIYPRVSHLVGNDEDRATALVRMSMVLVCGLGLALGITSAIGAPMLVRLFLGEGYEAAVPVLRVLSLLPPVIALGTVLGIHWALPMGLDRPFYRLVIAAGLLNIGLAVVLVPRLGALGMAISVVLVDVLVAGGLVALAMRRNPAIFKVPRRSVLRVAAVDASDR
jgi:PST family polysaccharide transporter